MTKVKQLTVKALAEKLLKLPLQQLDVVVLNKNDSEVLEIIELFQEGDILYLIVE